MKYVYILESLDSEHFYVGITDDLRARLAKHNAGGVPHRKGDPGDTGHAVRVDEPASRSRAVVSATVPVTGLEARTSAPSVRRLMSALRTIATFAPSSLATACP